MRVVLSVLAIAAATTPTNAFVPAFHVPKSLTSSVPPKIVPQASHGPFLPFSKTALSLSGPSVDSSSSGSLSEYLTRLLLETLIVNGVPAIFTLLVVAFIGFQFRPRRNNNNNKEDDDDSNQGTMADLFNNNRARKTNNPAAELYSDLYGGDESDNDNRGRTSPLAFFKRFQSPSSTPAATNRGIPPRQYIQMQNLNQKYDSYDFSLTAATQSKAKAAAAYRAKNFDRALRLGLNGGAANSAESGLSPRAKTALLELEGRFLRDGSKLVDVVQTVQTELTRAAIDREMVAMGTQAFELDPSTNATTNATADNATATDSKIAVSKMDRKAWAGLETRLSAAQKDLVQLELKFVRDVVATLGTERATGIRAALLGDIAARGTGGLLTQIQHRPLSVLLNAAGEDGHSPVPGDRRRKSVFVTRFPGDTTASQVAGLREEVTAIVRNARPGDEAMVILQTGGGTVTGYGLAAAQLLRFKDAGMNLTIAVEQVAASGGYMMCCVADKIVSSPFAVLGSIGVISDIPNVYERLKKEGIEFQTVTAGKYKRTITPTKKVTSQDFEKTKQDVEQILVLFKQFVHQNRPSLDIDAVATGETWFGADALERGLTDEIKTADEVLMEYVDNGWDVYEVKYTPPDKAPLAFAGVGGSSDDGGQNGPLSGAVRWLVRTLVQELKAELGTNVDLQQQASPEKRYMMIDDTAATMRSEYK